MRLSGALNLLVVSGATGVGKTEFLHEISSLKPTLDLEKNANHRGSAFGGFGTPQPSQTNFENQMASDLIRVENQLKNKADFVFVEDESRLIGARAIPECFFKLMRSSPTIFIEEPIEIRIENTFREYILNSNTPKDVLFQNFTNSIQRISKKLGGARAQEILQNITESEAEYNRTGALEFNKIWIRKILEWYYDPMYFGSINQRAPKILHRGTRKEILSQLDY
jgi:tRNA 2-selenouridine synthase